VWEERLGAFRRQRLHAEQGALRRWQWWPRRALCTHARRARHGFYSRAQGGGGAFLRAKVIEATVWPRYDGGVGGDVRRPLANGIRRCRRLAGESAAHGTDQGGMRVTHRSARHDAWSGGHRPVSVCVYGEVRRRATWTSTGGAGDARRPDFEFNLSLFEMSKLEISLHKWTKR
jgi:hypothetical protein